MSDVLGRTRHLSRTNPSTGEWSPDQQTFDVYQRASLEPSGIREGGARGGHVSA
jgi:hypothetical protein